MQVAGWVGIFAGFMAFYTGTAILTGEVYKHASPPPNVPVFTSCF